MILVAVILLPIQRASIVLKLITHVHGLRHSGRSREVRASIVLKLITHVHDVQWQILWYFRNSSKSLKGLSKVSSRQHFEGNCNLSRLAASLSGKWT